MPVAPYPEESRPLSKGNKRAAVKHICVERLTRALRFATTHTRALRFARVCHSAIAIAHASRVRPRGQYTDNTPSLLTWNAESNESIQVSSTFEKKQGVQEGTVHKHR